MCRHSATLLGCFLQQSLRLQWPPSGKAQKRTYQRRRKEERLSERMWAEARKRFPVNTNRVRRQGLSIAPLARSRWRSLGKRGRRIRLFHVFGGLRLGRTQGKARATNHKPTIHTTDIDSPEGLSPDANGITGSDRCPESASIAGIVEVDIPLAV